MSAATREFHPQAVKHAQHTWVALTRALEAPEWLDDPRFRGRRERRLNGEALAAAIEERLSRFPARDEAVAALERERVPVAPILTLNEAIAHPHLRERGTVRRVRDPFIGEFDVPGMPVKMSALPPKPELKAPLLGQDNEDVMRELLGLTGDEIASLYSEGVLVRDPKLGSSQ